MKPLQKLILIAILAVGYQLSSGQSIAIKANASLSTLGEVEATFITPGFSLEGKMGRHWSIGIDLGAGSNSVYSMVHFTPALKYYVNRSLNGFYIGFGIDAFRLKRENGGPIGYPFYNESALTGVAAGPQLMIGAQTIIDDIVAIGFQIGVGPAAAIESAFLHGVFSAGIAF